MHQMHYLVTHGVIITDAIKFVQQQKKDELSIERASFLLKLPKNNAADYYVDCLKNLGCNT